MELCAALVSMLGVPEARRVADEKYQIGLELFEEALKHQGFMRTLDLELKIDFIDHYVSHIREQMAAAQSGDKKAIKELMCQLGLERGVREKTEERQLQLEGAGRQQSQIKAAVQRLLSTAAEAAGRQLIPAGIAAGFPVTTPGLLSKPKQRWRKPDPGGGS
jgi:hypothetical protein